MPEPIPVEPVAVVGAGASGLAVCRALLERGIPFDCFERGSDVGGNWRYLNNSGTSSCYASLLTNISRRRMQYPSFPMPPVWGDYIHHTHMAEYLSAFADTFGLRPHIHFQTVITGAWPHDGGGWRVTTSASDAQAQTATRVYRALVVANGHDWDPQWPDFAGTFAGPVCHAHNYRTPEPFAGQRVLVVGAGNSASEIAAELAPVAARTYWSFRARVGRRDGSSVGVMPPVIEGQDLSKTFGVRCGFLGSRRELRAVDGVSLEVAAGETVALVGESGSGKSTLGRLLLGLLPPTSGQVRYAGGDVWQLRGEEKRRFRRDVQVVFQDTAASLNARRTVGASVAVPAWQCRMPIR